MDEYNRFVCKGKLLSLSNEYVLKMPTFSFYSLKCCWWWFEGQLFLLQMSKIEFAEFWSNLDLYRALGKLPNLEVDLKKKMFMFPLGLKYGWMFWHGEKNSEHLVRLSVFSTSWIGANYCTSWRSSLSMGQRLKSTVNHDHDLDQL